MYTLQPSEPQKCSDSLLDYKWATPIESTIYQSTNTYIGCISHHDKANIYGHMAKIYETFTFLSKQRLGEPFLTFLNFFCICKNLQEYYGFSFDGI